MKKSINLKINKLKKKIINLNNKPNFKNKNWNKKYKNLKLNLSYLLIIKKYKKCIKDSKKIMKLEEYKEIANEDIINSKNIIKKFIKKIKNLKKKEILQEIFIEIIIGTGGEESALFVSDLSKMYLKYSDKKNWKYKILSLNKNNSGGIKDITIYLKGFSIYKKLKFESGVHRVQRTPMTENKNRIHTSTCRVAVILKKKENELKINKNDFKIETFKSSGAGGQHVNKTNSAVRIKHIPTGIIVECQNERSQHKNKKEALKLIKYKINKNYKINIKNLNDIKKKNLLGGGERSEKIRTYNFPKNRLTDHRLNLSFYNLNNIIEGDLDYLLYKLKSMKN